MEERKPGGALTWKAKIRLSTEKVLATVFGLAFDTQIDILSKKDKHAHCRFESKEIEKKLLRKTKTPGLQLRYVVV